MNNIKTARCEANMTQRQAADALNIDRVTYARYESGLRVPSVQMLMAIAQLFNKSMDYLVGREKPVISHADTQALTEEEQELLRLWRTCDKTMHRGVINLLKANPAIFEERGISSQFASGGMQ